MEELINYMDAHQALDYVKQRFMFLGTQISAANQHQGNTDDEPALDRKRIKKFEEIINRDITWEKAKPSFAIVFEEVFTESERADLLRFYRSPNFAHSRPGNPARPLLRGLLECSSRNRSQTQGFCRGTAGGRIFL
jgi:hypothetical protein